MPTVRPPFHTFFPAPGKAWPPRGGQPRRPRQRLASSKKVTRKAPKACSGVSKKKRPSRQAQPKAQPKAKAKVRISAAAAAAAEYRFDFHVGVRCVGLCYAFYRRKTNHLSLIPCPYTLSLVPTAD